MTRLEMEEINKERFSAETSMPDDEKNLLMNCQNNMIIYGGYLDGKPIFHGGIIDYAPHKGELWSRIEDQDHAMPAAWYIRDMIDHIAFHKKYIEIGSSVIRGDKKLMKWSRWLGMKHISTSQNYEHYLWGGL